MTPRFAALLALAAVLVTGGCGGQAPPPPTARVDRGDVVASVRSTGSLAAVGEQKLGFRDGGRVTQVLVKVGDRVQPGQVLARLDDFALRQTLDQRQAGLAEQEAVLGRINGDPSVPSAQAALDQAQKAQDATEDEVDATNKANESATERARAQRKVEQQARDQAQSQLQAAKAACAAAASTSGSAATGGTGTGTTGGTGTASTTCDTSAAESAVLSAQSALVAAQSQVDAAEHAEDTGSAAGQVSIENARKTVVSAQNDLDSARSDRPFNVEEQQALVEDSRAQLAAAQRDIDDAVLTAPSAGVVTAINGVPGEFLSAPSAVTGQGPGGVPLPDGSGGPAATDPLPGTGAFLVLAAANAFEVVVPFEESDAAQVSVGQQVDLTVDALVDPTDPASTPPLHGRVLAIAPTGTDIDGVVSFYTTISIEDPVARMRSGMTAEAAVRTQVAQNVLRVPNRAVGRADGRPTVTITGPDGDPVTEPFEPGLVGDTFTEVRSGLQPGADVRLPQATVSATPSATPGRRGGRRGR